MKGVLPDAYVDKSCCVTCVHKDPDQLSTCHDKLGYHVYIVVSARSQLGGRFLTRPEPLIQLQVCGSKVSCLRDSL